MSVGELQDVVADGEWVDGAVDAPVTLVEYGDLECPDVRNAEPLMLELRNAFRGDLRYVYRHFPLIAKHPHAVPAAEAAEAAGEQGAFWTMRETLLANQKALTHADFIGYAAALGLDVAAFTEALESDRVRQKVASDLAQGVARGITGTPTFFINGQRFEQDELEALRPAIETGRGTGDGGRE